MLKEKGLVILIVLFCMTIAVIGFVYTTNMSVSTALKLVPPQDSDQRIDSSYSLVILLHKEEIYSYPNNNLSELKEHDMASLRECLVITKQQFTDPVVVIKADSTASPKRVIDVLDEMTINAVKRYAIVEPNEQEITALRNAKTRD